MTVQLSLVAFQLRWQHAILSKLNNKPNPPIPFVTPLTVRPSLAYVTANGLILICCSISGIHIVLTRILYPFPSHLIPSRDPTPSGFGDSTLPSVKNLARFCNLSRHGQAQQDDTFNLACQTNWANWSTIWSEIGFQINFYRFQSVHSISLAA